MQEPQALSETRTRLCPCYQDQYLLKVIFANHLTSLYLSCITFLLTSLTKVLIWAIKDLRLNESMQCFFLRIKTRYPIFKECLLCRYKFTVRLQTHTNNSFKSTPKFDWQTLVQTQYLGKHDQKSTFLPSKTTITVNRISFSIWWIPTVFGSIVTFTPVTLHITFSHVCKVICCENKLIFKPCIVLVLPEFWDDSSAFLKEFFSKESIWYLEGERGSSRKKCYSVAQCPA